MHLTTANQGGQKNRKTTLKKLRFGFAWCSASAYIAATNNDRP